MALVSKKIPGTFLEVDMTAQMIFANVSLAELNAGKTIFTPANGARQIRLAGFFILVNGAFTTLTDARLSTTETTPTDLVTIVQAQLGAGVKHSEDAGTNTIAAAFFGNLAVGTGLQIRKTGGTAAGGTSLDVILRFIYIT